MYFGFQVWAGGTTSNQVGDYNALNYSTGFDLVPLAALDIIFRFGAQCIRQRGGASGTFFVTCT